MSEYTAADVQNALKENRSVAVSTAVSYHASGLPSNLQSKMKEVLEGCFDKAVDDAGIIAAELNVAGQDKMQTETGSQPVMADGGPVDIGKVIKDAFREIFQTLVTEIAAGTPLTEVQVIIAGIACAAVAMAIGIGFKAGVEYERMAEKNGVVSEAIEQYIDP